MKAKRILAHFGPDTVLDEITSEAVADWSESMQRGGLLEHKGNGVWVANEDKGLAVRSVNAYLACLRAVLKKAASKQWNYLKVAPEVKMVDGKKPKLRFLDADEAAALIKGALPDKSANTDSLHLQQLIRFLLGTGARKTEALSLTSALCRPRQQRHGRRCGSKTPRPTCRARCRLATRCATCCWR